MMPEVPAARSIKKLLVLPLKKTLPMSEKKKALRPKAASGKAVGGAAVVRPVEGRRLDGGGEGHATPKPVRKEKKHMRATEPESVVVRGAEGEVAESQEDRAREDGRPGALVVHEQSHRARRASTCPGSPRAR